MKSLLGPVRDPTMICWAHIQDSRSMLMKFDWHFATSYPQAALLRKCQNVINVSKFAETQSKKEEALSGGKSHELILRSWGRSLWRYRIDSPWIFYGHWSHIQSGCFIVQSTKHLFGEKPIFFGACLGLVAFRASRSNIYFALPTTRPNEYIFREYSPECDAIHGRWIKPSHTRRCACRTTVWAIRAAQLSSCQTRPTNWKKRITISQNAGNTCRRVGNFFLCLAWRISRKPLPPIVLSTTKQPFS